MRSLTKCLLLATLCGTANPALANEDTAYWQNLNLTLKVNDEFRVSSETSFRSSDARGFYQLQETLMVGYKPSKNVTIWAGYVHSPGYNHGDFAFMERRFRQQVNVDNLARIGSVKINGRVRLEQRWRDNTAGTGWRLRPSLRATVPVVGKVNLVIGNESFFNLNTTSFQNRDGVERMRNSAALSIPRSKSITIEVGYMNQHAFVRAGPDNVDHVLTTALSVSL